MFIASWAFVARTSIQSKKKKKKKKKDIAIFSEDGKIIQTSMNHFLLLLLRNATKHNSIKFSAPRLHISSDKFWNCLKDLKCNNVMLNILICWWFGIWNSIEWVPDHCFLYTLRSAKFWKNICKASHRLKCKKFRKKSQKSILYVFHFFFFFFFFQPPYLHKMVCFLNSWKQIVKTNVR